MDEQEVVRDQDGRVTLSRAQTPNWRTCQSSHGKTKEGGPARQNNVGKQ